MHTCSWEEIKAGKVTDVYFQRALAALGELADTRVAAEITIGSLPDDYEWAVLAGIEEAAQLFEDRNVDVYSMPEGTVFKEDMPVMRIEGPYKEFCVYETPLLGLICQASGIATKAARCRIAAGKKPLINFGTRRMHPAITPMIARAAVIGGCDGFANTGAGKTLGFKASGTMPHSLILIYGDQAKAWKAFDAAMPRSVPRVALCDTLSDEKTEALMAAKALGKRLDSVRLDTPGSRRGDMNKICREVRWELDTNGYKHVKIFVSGGLDENSIQNLTYADGFGVGTSISNAPTINFALDIVEIKGRPFTKRGKKSGRKQVWRSGNNYTVTLWNQKSRGEALIKPLVKKGKIVSEPKTPRELRSYVLKQLKGLEL